jgi:hypothetical protein
MTPQTFADIILARVRALLRQQCPMSRYAVDLLLADFENDFRSGLDDVIADEIEEARAWDRAIQEEEGEESARPTEEMVEQWAKEGLTP